MSMTDKLRESISNMEKESAKEEELRNLLNSASSMLIKQFIQKLHTGEVPLDNIADFVRVLGVYKEINDIDSALEGKQGASALPEIGFKQEKVFDEAVEEGKIGTDEEGLLDVGSLSEEDVQEVLRGLDIQQNKQNEESI